MKWGQFEPVHGEFDWERAHACRATPRCVGVIPSGVTDDHS